MNMTSAAPNNESDEWSRWLLHQRHAGDATFRQQIQKQLDQFAQRVLDGAHLAPGETLVDVGCGEGLIAFGAIDRIGESLNVILTDVSAPMIAHAQGVAKKRGVVNQCWFIQCPADDLTTIPDASVDVVTTRAVLAYVADRSKALQEFFRILRPGGRISICEPVLQDEAFIACALRAMVNKEVSAPEDPFRPLLYRWRAAQFPDTHEKLLANPLTNYTERTLFETVRSAGFAPIHAQLHLDFAPSEFTSWDVFVESSPHPWAPSLKEILAQQFSSEERRSFEQMMRPLVESGTAPATSRTLYLCAEKAR